ncbi:aspartyl-phosphate phosphatase Spo0E family protein [Oceanobacillus damuensis]
MAKKSGLSPDETITCSQELDSLLNCLLEYQ